MYQFCMVVVVTWQPQKQPKGHLSRVGSKHGENQYGAVPTSKDPIQKEMETTGDTTGIGVSADGGGSTQVIAEDYDRSTTIIISVNTSCYEINATRCFLHNTEHVYVLPSVT
ncbi:unnamed protein product [Sphenostylis stenocarpa]|uniref:Uncharacterized protein n=1 Tax=Sphenostylis stenocarpa TaxID=92480 RepID=A0AA86V6F8_9FABA|nr:unnamed protein product [Sphenostylis stenocarpa]